MRPEQSRDENANAAYTHRAICSAIVRERRSCREMHMRDGRTNPPSGWRRLPKLARQLGITDTAAWRCARALACRDRAMQTITGLWYVDPVAFTEHAMRTVRKLRVQGST